jgi:hypothetical protein
MRRSDLEHVVGAAANVTGEDDFVVIGSQAILGPYPTAPEELLRSMEADIFPLRRPELSDEIDGALGDGSQFHRTHGYYAHGVGPETAKAPRGWQDRLVRVDVPPRVRSPRSPVDIYGNSAGRGNAATAVERALHGRAEPDDRALRRSWT